MDTDKSGSVSICVHLWLIIAFSLIASAGPARRANTFHLGGAEIEWISTSSFRFNRAPTPSRSPISSETVEVQCAGQMCRTRHIEVNVSNGELRVRTRAGKVLLAPEGVEGERFYGLGARATPKLELNGSRIEATGGLLISSNGYGEYRPARCTYDFTGPRRTVACGGDFYFYYGPEPKEVLEEHAAVVTPAGESAWIARRDTKRRTWSDLRDALYALQHAGMSGLAGSPFVLSGYEGEARTRAEQIAALLPVVHARSAAQPDLRKRLSVYLETYAWEARDRGIPVVRPLAMQFPEDAAGAGRTDEFMVGDEMLAAPVLEPARSVKVYLPRGIWTELATDAVYKGRQEITVEAPPDRIPMFVRNGMIVPLAGPVLELHYFPRLAAEWFLWEPEIDGVSQFHAAPALDLLRLESESLKDREFEWVVHHWPEARNVRGYTRVPTRARMKPGTWMLDGETLRVRVRATAGGDEIVHVENR